WRAWLAATLVGGLMLAGGNGVVCWAEQWVPSGETALILSCGPLWMVLLPWFARRAPAPRPAVIGSILVGLAGGGNPLGAKGSGARTGAAGHALLVGRLALLVASLNWVIGSLLSRGVPLPSSVGLASAMEMIGASPILFLVAWLHGDWSGFHLGGIPARGWV